MKVAFTQRAMDRLGALHKEDGRDARDLVRRLRSATSPVGRSIGGEIPTYEASLGHKGVLIRYEVQNSVATVDAVTSAVTRAREASGLEHDEP
jgi:hypothetical protein